MADFDDLPDLDAELKTSSKKGNMATIIFGVVIVVAFLTILFTLKGPISSAFKSAPKTTDDSAAQSYTEYLDFAQNFTSAVFNVSYTNISTQIQRAAEYMSDDLLASYKTNLMNPAFRQKINDVKASCVYQKVDNVQLEAADAAAGRVTARVDGTMTFNSDVNGAQIQLPFSVKVFMQKTDGKIKGIDFMQRL